MIIRCEINQDISNENIVLTNEHNVLIEKKVVNNQTTVNSHETLSSTENLCAINGKSNINS